MNSFSKEKHIKEDREFYYALLENYQQRIKSAYGAAVDFLKGMNCEMNVIYAMEKTPLSPVEDFGNIKGIMDIEYSDSYTRININGRIAPGQIPPLRVLHENRVYRLSEVSTPVTLRSHIAEYKQVSVSRYLTLNLKSPLDIFGNNFTTESEDVHGINVNKITGWPLQGKHLPEKLFHEQSIYELHKKPVSTVKTVGVFIKVDPENLSLQTLVQGENAVVVSALKERYNIQGEVVSA